jgi:D-arginine dehydrogenase
MNQAVNSGYFDFAIVGAGFAGLATAYYLAKNGQRGIILEKEDHVGAHASGKNAAMFRQLHNDMLTFELANRSRDFFDHPQRRHLLDNRGSLLLTHEAKGQEQLNQYPSPISKWGTSQRMTRQETLQHFAYLENIQFSTAAFTSTDGMIDLQGLLAYFLGEALAGGFMLRSHCKIESAQKNGELVELKTSLGVIPCKVVINAAGAWASNLAEQLGAQPLALSPLKRHILRIDQPDWLPPTAPFIWHMDDDYYLRHDEQEGRSSVLSSLCDESPANPDDENNDVDIEARFAAHIQKRCKPLLPAKVQEVWACLRTYAPDRRPIVGWDQQIPWLFWVAGLGGHGVTTCAALGEFAATLLIAGPLPQLPENSGMSPRRF